MFIKDEYDSLILQSLASTSLLAELSNNNYLNSDHFKSLKFKNKPLKSILITSSIGNPATLQMFLYAILVIPKELEEQGKIRLQLNRLEATFEKLKIHKYSNYFNAKHFNYIRHIRNAVVHNHCFFSTQDNMDLVTFKDHNPDNKAQYCEFTISTQDVAIILMDVQKILFEYFNKKYNLTGK